MNSDSSFLKALNKEILPTPPIWYMRQAGRYMPEQQNVRKKFKNFLDMCKEPDVCCELALQPINAFKLDAAILFSDILTIPDSFGLGVEFVEKKVLFLIILLIPVLILAIQITLILRVQIMFTRQLKILKTLCQKKFL